MYSVHSLTPVTLKKGISCGYVYMIYVTLTSAHPSYEVLADI